MDKFNRWLEAEIASAREAANELAFLRGMELLRADLEAEGEDPWELAEDRFPCRENGHFGCATTENGRCTGGDYVPEA